MTLVTRETKMDKEDRNASKVQIGLGCSTTRYRLRTNILAKTFIAVLLSYSYYWNGTFLQPPKPFKPFLAVLQDNIPGADLVSHRLSSLLLYELRAVLQLNCDCDV